MAMEIRFPRGNTSKGQCSIAMFVYPECKWIGMAELYCFEADFNGIFMELIERMDGKRTESKCRDTLPTHFGLPGDLWTYK